MNTDTKKTETKQCTIPSVVQRFFNKIGWKIVQKTCKHTDSYNKWTDYQDRYYEDYCPDCKLTTFEGMD
jgi:hypothetical protein